jgi:hypothetical protein
LFWSVTRIWSLALTVDEPEARDGLALYVDLVGDGGSAIAAQGDVVRVSSRSLF